MHLSGWIQLAVYVGILLAITKPMGLYLLRVLDPERAGGGTFLDPVLGPIERLIYKIIGVDPKREHSWKQYLVAMLIFSLITMVITYGILRLQSHLPMNYVDSLSNKTAMTTDLAFNTAASFTTNTNWQSYGGENTMSYFSQMVGLASHNFFSAAVGIVLAAALVRGISRDRSRTIGNFLARPGADAPVPAAPDLRLLCDLPGEPGNGSELQAVYGRYFPGSVRGRFDDPALGAKHCPGAGGIADGDQNARNQRRRILQCQCRPSL